MRRLILISSGALLLFFLPASSAPAAGAAQGEANPPIAQRAYASVAAVDSLTCYIAGKGGILLKTSDGGLSWKRLTIPPDRKADLYGLFFTSRTRGVVVGPHGLILTTTDGGANWTRRPSPTEYDLVTVRFFDASTGWIAGFKGTLLRTTDGGQSWAPERSGVTSALWSVSFVSSAVGWAGGSGGTLLKTTDGGNHWATLMSAGATLKGFVYAIDFLSPAVGWAVGEYGLTARTTDGGISWTRENLQDDGLPRDPMIFGYSAHFFNGHQGLISGSDGSIRSATDDGRPFRARSTHTTAPLLSLSFPGRRASTGWAAGMRGTILKTSDGGATWIDQSGNAE